ncbi:MAG: DTW domain-containing protein [Planctomycetes bacterium]|nr:DTW domain-containing protein [Planctomycetota bacterium]
MREYDPRAGDVPRNPGAARCSRCGMHVHACLCDELRPREVATRVVVLRHRKEAHKTTNTGRLVPLMLAGSELRAFGERHDVLSASNLIDPARNTLLLYPGKNSRELCAADAARSPVKLIVPDANWRRAFKLTTREPALAALPRVHLPEGAPSIYRLRRHTDPRFLATFEAVARALGILEGAEVEAHLMRVFALMVERTLHSRGRFTRHHPLDLIALDRSVHRPSNSGTTA